LTYGNIYGIMVFQVAELQLRMLKPPSGGLRVGGSQRTDEISQIYTVYRNNTFRRTT
jgi:hypothetical protein